MGSALLQMRAKYLLRKFTIRNYMLYIEKNLFDFFTTHGVIKGDRDYQKTIILANRRTGTHYLLSLLRSRWDVKFYAEIFDDNRIDFFTTGYTKYQRDENLLALREKDPARFIDEIIFSPQPGRVKVLGFKLMYHQITPLISKHLKGMRDLKIIHLKRKNYMKSHLSWEIAQRQRRWQIRKGDSVNLSPIHMDYNECARKFKKISENEKKYDDYFEQNQKIDIFYKDLYGDQQSTMERVQSFLGLDPVPLRSNLEKIVTKPISEVIANYRELKDKFRGTPWASFFEE